jgi:hypothetical protein
MRALRFLPLASLVGIDGFVMFAPYVILVLSLAYFARRVRMQQQPIFIPAQ